MNTLEIVIVVVVALLVLLALGGALVLRRRREAGETRFHERLEQANHDLAAAHAVDKGWAPDRVQLAARRAFETERGGAPVDELVLVQVVDRPGTDDDQAVYRVVSGDGTAHLTLGRRGDEWHLESLDEE